MIARAGTPVPAPRRRRLRNAWCASSSSRSISLKAAERHSGRLSARVQPFDPAGLWPHAACDPARSSGFPTARPEPSRRWRRQSPNGTLDLEGLAEMSDDGGVGGAHADCRASVRGRRISISSPPRARRCLAVRRPRPPDRGHRRLRPRRAAVAPDHGGHRRALAALAGGGGAAVCGRITAREGDAQVMMALMAS